MDGRASDVCPWIHPPLRLRCPSGGPVMGCGPWVMSVLRKEEMSTRYFGGVWGLWALVALLSVGCGDTADPSQEVASCPEESDAVEVDGGVYCVFVGVEALIEDCPDDFPNGSELRQGVVVCAQDGQDVPRDALSAELEARDLLPECLFHTDCPSRDGDVPRCEGNEVVYSEPVTGFCENNRCDVAVDDGFSVGPDCAARGQICRSGQCVPIPCSEDLECQGDEAQPPRCEDNVVHIDNGQSGRCVEGGCVFEDNEPSRIDCAESGQVCLEGQCVTQ